MNKKLLIGWKDSTACGVDYVDAANAPYPTSMIQFLIEDSNEVWKENEASEFVSLFLPLESDQSVSLSASIDSGSFVSNSDTTSTNDISSRISFSNSRYHEIQMEIDLVAGTNSPTILGSVFSTNLNEGEGMLG